MSISQGPDDDGGPVPISVQFRGERPAGESRPDRKRALSSRLHLELDDVKGLDIDWPTLSLSAQTVQGRVAPTDLDRVREQLEDQGLRVDVVVERQVVDPDEPTIEHPVVTHLKHKHNDEGAPQ